MEFAEQADLTLLVPHELVQTVSANALIGTYTLQEGIDLLLAGTGLSPTFSNEVVLSISTGGASAGEGETMETSKQGGLVAVLAGILAGGVEAQEPISTDEAEENEAILEQIIVTGSRIRGAQNASPIVTISREEIDMAGFATVEEVVENLPQNFGAGATLDARTDATNRQQIVGGEVGDFAGGTSVNLRGLGADSTLVLLNGRRLSPSGNSASFINIASIPVTAIERIEVMTDGASAIYGSDAIGGVINFILRDSYDGAETRLRYGSDTGGDTTNVQLGQTFGTSWSSGNVLLTYEYRDSDPLASADRPFTASDDLSPFGGTDRRRPGGNPGNIVAFGQTFAIPPGQDGTALTAADFVGLANTRNFFNSRENQDVMGSQEQHSAFLHLKQTVGSVELFSAARYSNNEQATRLGRSVVTLPVFASNPWFVDPTGIGLPLVVVEYTVTDDFGPSISVGEIESAGATVGTRFEFSDDWGAELAFNWSEEEGQLAISNRFDFSALFAAVNSPDPNLAFNPFGDGSNTSPAVIESLVNRDKERFNTDKNRLLSANLDVNGNAFKLAGGVVKVAAGIDFREESLDIVSFIVGTGEARPTSLERDILAVYAEVLMPLVGNANRRTGLQRLEVSLAARHEDYSDFGSSTDPKLGFVWSPTESLMLRGTIGTSFRAPSLTDLNEESQSWGYIPEGFFGVTPFGVLLKQGRNRDLQAQEATTWTTGFEWTPKSVEGLSMSATYFNVDFTGRIEAPASGTNVFAAFSDSRFASVLMLDPSSEQIAAFVNAPNYNSDGIVAGGPFPAADILSGALPVGGIFDNRLTNLAQSVITGAELQFSYAFATAVGSFSLGFNGSYMFDFERRLLESDPLFDEVDTLGRPVDFRGRGNLTWNRDHWSVAGYVNYTDGYTDSVSSPARTVDSWTTVDLTIGYNTGSNASFLSDIRLALTTQNLFDEDPPFVDTIGGVGYDATNASPLGRFFALQVTKDW